MRRASHPARWVLVCALILVTAVYSAGLGGGWLFDDYPNIVNNHGVQPAEATVSSLVRAALSSPSSEFKRPLASLSFAANYLASGLDPFGWKLTNLAIHLLNGLLVFLLTRALLLTGFVGAHPVRDALSSGNEDPSRTGCAPTKSRVGVVAALTAGAWMLLPINLTGVLYVVQRMESMANLFVLLGLLGYVVGRGRMLSSTCTTASTTRPPAWRWFWFCAISITVPAGLGLLAKETAVMLPLYAALIEWALFHWRKSGSCHAEADRPAPTHVGRALPAVSHHVPLEAATAGSARPTAAAARHERDWRIIVLFMVALVLPMIIGLCWLLPGLLKPAAWATRDFTLGTRLLSEARIVTDYIGWTLLPTPGALSFYHDDFHVSTGLLMPWTTLAGMIFLAGLITLAAWLRSRQPLTALGIALFLGCQLLTGTILPLELIYEHRNYFASFGLMLAIIPLLAAPSRRAAPGATLEADPSTGTHGKVGLPMALPRHALLAMLLLYWTTLTTLTAYAWGDPLRLAEDLASRAPESPRAQYELGRTYIINSHYDPDSPFTLLAYAPLEASAALPNSSILPEQALIFMNARMGLRLKDAWWNSLIAKLKAKTPGVQDESSLSSLTQCVRS